MLGIIEKLFGSANDRYLRKLQPHVERINDMEEDMKAMSDEELKAQTQIGRASCRERVYCEV